MNNISAETEKEKILIDKFLDEMLKLSTQSGDDENADQTKAEFGATSDKNERDKAHVEAAGRHDDSKAVEISDKKLEEYKTAAYKEAGGDQDKADQIYKEKVDTLTNRLEHVKADIETYSKKMEETGGNLSYRLLSSYIPYQDAKAQYDTAVYAYAHIGGKTGENAFVTKVPNESDLYADKKDLINANIIDTMLINRIKEKDFGTELRNLYKDEKGVDVHQYDFTANHMLNDMTSATASEGPVMKAIAGYVAKSLQDNTDNKENDAGTVKSKNGQSIDVDNKGDNAVTEESKNDQSQAQDISEEQIKTDPIMVQELQTANQLYDNKKYGEASSIYEKYQKDDAEAAYKLGTIHYYGYMGSKDYLQAMKYYKTAAEHKNPHANAMYQLGRMYQHAEGIEKNDIIAMDWYQKAADHGDKNAMFWLGYCYGSGECTDQNYLLAKYWYQKAVEKKSYAAMNNLGVLYENGYGVKQDYKSAFGWFKKAAGAELPIALKNMGRFYENGWGTPDGKKDIIKAYEFYQKAAKKGDDFAQKKLKELEPEVKLAREKAETAIKQAREKAEAEKKAAEERKAAEKAAVRERVKKAAAERALADQEAEKNMSAEDKKIQAELKRARSLYQKKNYPDAMEICMKYQESQPEAALILGLAYQFKEPSDLDMAMDWYRQAAESGNGEAGWRLGQIYLYNKDKRDTDEAMLWFLKSASQGYADAMNTLGFMYDTGDKGVSLDYHEAQAWFLMAAEAGNYVAKYNLGLYYQGLKRGIAHDYIKAREYYLESAECGYAPAMYRLGMMYLNGTGVQEDKEEAILWLKKAASKNDESARKKLDELSAIK